MSNDLLTKLSWVVAGTIVGLLWALISGQPVVMLLVFAALIIACKHWEHAWREHKEDQSVLLLPAGVREAWLAIGDRRELARQYDPEKRRAQANFVPQGAAPQPATFMTPRGAEEVAATWMRYLGEGDAKTTRFVADGGIDVVSNHYIAQVKHYIGTVGVGEVRQLAGAASVDGRKALFFTSGTYAKGAIKFAEQSRIALFQYTIEDGTIHGVNELARRALSHGL
jgi:hypothetical protein